MRIPARWAWIPLAITVAGVVYLSLVKAASYTGGMREPRVERPAPKPFVPPPPAAKHEPVVAQPPEAEIAPIRPPAPALPPIQLPPYKRK